MPLGVCAQGHEEHEATGHSAGVTAVSTHAPDASAGHAHGGHVTAGESVAVTHATSADAADSQDVPAGEHAPVPTDCIAMSGCGTPALSVGAGPELQTGELGTRRAEAFSSSSPLAVDLGITTPPPRI